MFTTRWLEHVSEEAVSRLRPARKASAPRESAVKALHFQRTSPCPELYQKLDALPDRTLFQTKPWLDFIARTQNAEPVFGTLCEGETQLGWFTGFIVKKGGCRILGSPFRGWTTEYLGFNLQEGWSRIGAIQTMRRHAFRQLGCVHMELMDRHFTCEEANRAALAFNVFGTYEIDLSRTEDDILAGMSHGRKQSIRKSTKLRQITITEAADPHFAEEYYEQLRDVFAKQGLLPTYRIERVKALIDCLLPTGRLLLLRAADMSGRCVATGIFPAFNGTMYFWGGASYRVAQRLSPNEPLQWYAMRYWKHRGIVRYDMGGGGSYKEQYGGRRLEIPWISESRNGVVNHLRNGAYRMYKFLRQLRGLGVTRTPRS